jgi:hypothetical protein
MSQYPLLCKRTQRRGHPDRLLGCLTGAGDGDPHGSRFAALRNHAPDSGIRCEARRLGCVLGFAGAAADSTLLRSLLFAVSPFDPLVLTVAALGVLLLAMAASTLPALRAASIDPMQALRGEQLSPHGGNRYLAMIELESA